MNEKYNLTLKDRILFFPCLNDKLILEQKENIDYQVNNYRSVGIFSSKSLKWNLAKGFFFLHIITGILIYFKLIDIDYMALGFSFLLYFVLFIFILKGNKISIVLLGLSIVANYLLSVEEISNNVKLEGGGITSIVSLTFITWYFLSMSYQIYIIERDKKI